MRNAVAEKDSHKHDMSDVSLVAHACCTSTGVSLVYTHDDTIFLHPKIEIYSIPESCFRATLASFIPLPGFVMLLF